MKYDKMNRRLFLQGLGKTTLALPLLPSLLPDFALAQADIIPPRYVMLFFPYGPVADATWYPSTLPTQSTYLSPAVTHSVKNSLNATAHYMHHDLIPSTSSGISAMFDSKFLAYKSQMSILRGICKNGKSGGAGHMGSVLLGDNTEVMKHSEYQRTPTIDQVMVNTPGFYPAGATNIKDVIYTAINPNYWPGDKGIGSGQMSWKWNKSLSKFEATPAEYNPSVLWGKLFGHMQGGTGGGGGTTTTTPQVNPRSATPIIDSVMEDFRRVRNGRAISSEDKINLQNHMDMMADLEKDLRPPAPDAPPPPTPGNCIKPADPKAPYYDEDDHNLNYSSYESNWGLQAKALNSLMVAAFNCGLSRVAVMNVNFPVGWHIHKTQGNASQTAKLFGLHKKVVDEVAYDLISKMGAVSESNGKTMLDNSLVQLSGGSGNGDHSPFNYPVALWGSAGGQLNTGLYIDYRRRDRTNNGLLLSQLQCTIMRAMGLQPSDWNMKAMGFTGSKIPDSASGWGDYYNGDLGHQATWSLTEATYKHARQTAGDWLPVLKA